MGMVACVCVKCLLVHGLFTIHCMYGCCREVRIIPSDVCIHCMHCMYALYGCMVVGGGSDHSPPLLVIRPPPCELVPVVCSGSEFTVPKRMSDEVIQSVALSNLGVVIVSEMIYRYMYIYVAGCSQILGSEL